MLPDKLFAEPALYLLCFGRGGVVIECCPLDVVCSFFCCGVAVMLFVVQLPFPDFPQKNSFNRLNIDMGGCVYVLMSIISQMYDYFTEKRNVSFTLVMTKGTGNAGPPSMY